jgi:hypothetical protein
MMRVAYHPVEQRRWTFFIGAANRLDLALGPQQ